MSFAPSFLSLFSYLTFYVSLFLNTLYTFRSAAVCTSGNISFWYGLYQQMWQNLKNVFVFLIYSHCYRNGYTVHVTKSLGTLNNDFSGLVAVGLYFFPGNVTPPPRHADWPSGYRGDLPFLKN
jgi:hypothetical protein